MRISDVAYQVISSINLDSQSRTFWSGSRVKRQLLASKWKRLQRENGGGISHFSATELPQARQFAYFPSLPKKQHFSQLVRGVDRCSLCLFLAKNSLPWGHECLALGSWGKCRGGEQRGKGVTHFNPREPTDIAACTAPTLHVLGQACALLEDSTSSRLWVCLLQGKKKDGATGQQIHGTGPDFPVPQPQLGWSALLSHIGHPLCHAVTNSYISHSSKSYPVLLTQSFFHLWPPTNSLSMTLGLHFPPHPASIPPLSHTYCLANTFNSLILFSLDHKA